MKKQHSSSILRLALTVVSAIVTGTPLPASADSYPPGSLWLEVSSISNSTLGLILRGSAPGTNYEILSKEALRASISWMLEQPLVGAPGQDWTPVQISRLSRPSLFLWACRADPLWLEITRVATNTAFLVVHPPPAEAANGVYDLFMTTSPGLNATNWLWTRRTLPGQTAISVSGLPVNTGFFVLGTMQDSNGDGVSDAYTQLVGLTDNSDLDGDGVSNVDEMRQGRNPQVYGAVADANGVALLDVFTVLR